MQLLDTFFNNIVGMDHLDVGRKMNVHKIFRRRPGRFMTFFLNVLCTFNFRLVFRGKIPLISFYTLKPEFFDVFRGIEKAQWNEI